MSDLYVVGYDGQHISIPARLPLSTASKVVELANNNLAVHGKRIDAEMEELRSRAFITQGHEALNRPYWFRFTVTMPDEPSIFDTLLIDVQ